MKSVPTHIGNIKLRGKKSRLLSCGCCVAQNFKDKEREKEAAQEIERCYKDYA